MIPVAKLGRLSGRRVLLVSWAIWLTVFAVLPVEPSYANAAWGLLLASNAAFLLAAGFPTTPAGGRTLEVEKVSRYLLPLTLAGAIGLAARWCDFLLVRGVDLSEGTRAARDVLGVGPNIFSAVAAVLLPCTLVAGVFGVVVWFAGGRHRLAAALAIGVAAAAPLPNFVFGGRSLLALITGTLAVAAFLAAPRISWRMMAAGLLTLIALFWVSKVLFLGRIEDVGGRAAFYETMRSSVYTQRVPLEWKIIAFIDEAPSAIATWVFYLTSVGQYYVHGVFEFFELVAYKQSLPQPDPLLGGQYQFFILEQFHKLMTPAELREDLESFNPVSGVFSTFWGPAYIDFGYTGTILYSFLLGLLVRGIQAGVLRGHAFALPLYCLALMQVFLMPIVNSVLMAGALYYDLVLAALWGFAALTLHNSASAPIGHAVLGQNPVQHTRGLQQS